jgi:hypothetical protein
MALVYGQDVSCTDGLRTGRYVSEARLVAEACYRRLTTPRGMLRGGEEEQNYGLDLVELIGSTSTKSDAAALPGRIKAELKKDERVETVETTVSRIVDGPAVRFEIEILVTTAAGPFTLMLSVNDVTVELLGIEEG